MNNTSSGRVLIMTAVEAEREAVLRGLSLSGVQDPRFDVVVAGVGPAFAAARTARMLAAADGRCDLVISAGIGGVFPGRAEIGSLVVAAEIVAADLGVETADGFLSVDTLGFGSARFTVDALLAASLTAALQDAGCIATLGTIATVSTATGTAATADRLAARIPGVAAEAMEGAGVAAAASDAGVPVLEIRAISNAVGPRNREAWRIGDALAALQAAASILSEVLRNR